MKQVVYDYAEYGYVADFVPRNTIYLDVGNSFSPGVIDHHHVGAEGVFRSATRMVWTLLQGKETEPWKNAGATRSLLDDMRVDEETAGTIVIHKDPDLDALVSAFILDAYLTRGACPPVPEGWIDLVDAVDTGAFSNDELFSGPRITLYDALEILQVEALQEGGKDGFEAHERLRKEFFGLLEAFLQSEGSAMAFFRERGLLEKVKRVVEESENPNDHPEEGVRVPVFERDGEAFHWTERPVVWIEMTHDTYFNILKARYRRKDSPVWIVHYPPEMNGGKHRIVLSVDYELPYGLFGYGWRLERLERANRESAEGPLRDQYPPRRGEPRPGYNGPDPWYSGDTKQYTIVDAPNSGTILGIPDSGRPAKAFLLSLLSSENPEWERHMVESVLDAIGRLLGLLSDEAAQPPGGQAPRSGIDKAVVELVALARGIHRRSQAGGEARHRLLEGLAGAALLNEPLQDHLMSRFQELERFLTDMETFRSYRKEIGKILLEDQGFSVLDHASRLAFAVRGKDKASRELLFQCLSGIISRERVQVLSMCFSFAWNWPKGPPARQEPRLYRMAEYAELLHQLDPGTGADSGHGEECLVWKSLRQLYAVKEGEAVRLLGVNPLLHRFRCSRKTLERPLLIAKLANESETYRAQDDEFFLTDTHVLFTAVLKAWYELGIFLSGSKERHCRDCGSCNPESNEGFRSELPPARRLLSYAKAADRFTPALQAVVEQMASVAEAALAFFEAQTKELPVILTLARNTQAVLASFRETLSTVTEAMQQEEMADWWIHAIRDALTDIEQYFDDAGRELDEFRAILESNDVVGQETLAKQLLMSLTIEQLYDREGSLIPQALETLFGGKEEKTVQEELEAIQRVRSRLRRLSHKGAAEGQGTEAGGVGDEKLPHLLRKLYETRHETLMDLPATLKMHVFGLIVHKMQEGLSLRISARLLDAFHGKTNRVIPVVDPLFRMLVHGRTSLRALFSAWVPVLGGFGLTVLVWPEQGMKWYMGLLLAWVCFVLLRLLGEGKLYATGVGKTDELHMRSGGETRKRKNVMDAEVGISRYVTGQLLPQFTVPMVLALSPFVLSDELKEFVYLQCNSLPRLVVPVIVFGGLSIFALNRLQNSTNPHKLRNLISVYSTVWTQSFILSVIFPVVLQNSPMIGKIFSQSKAEMLEKDVCNIPMMIEMVQGNIVPINVLYGHQIKLYVFPVASILFSFLCLFVAIFLEGLVKQKK